MHTRSLRYFSVGFCAGMLLLLTTIARSPAAAGHGDTTCGPAAWAEVVKENNDEVEDGNHAKIKVAFPDGGPVNNGGLVRSLFVWDNEDNWAEVGWLWYDGVHSGPRRFRYRADAGQLGGDENDGDGGSRGNFYDWKVDNDHGNHFEAFREGTKYHAYTFVNLDGGRVYASSEVDNRCDSAIAEFKDLSDKETNTAPYGPWVDTRRADAFLDSPFFVRCLLSDTAFDVRHMDC